MDVESFKKHSYKLNLKLFERKYKNTKHPNRCAIEKIVENWTELTKYNPFGVLVGCGVIASAHFIGVLTVVSPL